VFMAASIHYEIGPKLNQCDIKRGIVWKKIIRLLIWGRSEKSLKQYD